MAPCWEHANIAGLQPRVHLTCVSQSQQGKQAVAGGTWCSPLKHECCPGFCHRGCQQTALRLETLLGRISDPEATKPDDWDEDAPKEIPDMDAEKPEGWLDDEPDEIDDPGASCCYRAGIHVLQFKSAQLLQCAGHLHQLPR